MRGPIGPPRRGGEAGQYPFPSALTEPKSANQPRDAKTYQCANNDGVKNPIWGKIFAKFYAVWSEIRFLGKIILAQTMFIFLKNAFLHV